MVSAEVIVLDTHALIFWVTQSARLGREAAREIGRAGVIGVPGVVLWEAAMLVERGELRVTPDAATWLREVTRLPRVEILHITPTIAVTAVAVGRAVRGDPIDPLITATAIAFAAPLITRDTAIQDYAGVRTFW